jgi:RimJ/RimL family protein N-acetyltransferase
MFPILTDKDIYTFLPEQPPASLEALQNRYAFLSNRISPDGTEHWLNWIIFESVSGEAVGFIQSTVRAESCSFAYVLNPFHWDRGFASEAAAAVLEHLFNVYELMGVTAEINPNNERSIKLAIKLGFTFERHDNIEGDDIYKLSRTKWQAKEASVSNA